jgi:hypothetical protein
VKGKTAALLFLGVCVCLAALLFLKVITPVVSGAIFAVALVLLGGTSSGFRRK